MYFSIYAKDKPDHLSVRMETRALHIEYLKEHVDKMLAFGPMLTDDGDSPIGSLLIMNFDNIEQAREWAAGDPYAKAGLFESTEIHAWRELKASDL
jgi:uncharacterized protein YciI